MQMQKSNCLSQISQPIIFQTKCERFLLSAAVCRHCSWDSALLTSHECVVVHRTATSKLTAIDLGIFFGSIS